MKSDKKLSVVFSFKNEENNILELIKRTKNTLEKCTKLRLISNYEIIFIDDASTDKSFQILKKKQEELPEIKIHRTTRSFGNSECTRYGISASKGDYVVFLDCDLQDPPEIILEMLETIISTRVDVIYTQRKSRKGESPIKLLITWIGYRFLSLISSYPLLKDVGDYTLISRRVVEIVKSNNEKLPYTRGFIQYLGFPYQIIRYNRSARNDGQENTKFPLLSFRVWYQYFDRALLSTTDFPLKVLFPISLTMFFAIILILIHTLKQFLIGNAIGGWASIMVTILFTSSLNFLGLALISLYINNTYLNTRNRKDIIIRDIFD